MKQNKTQAGMSGAQSSALQLPGTRWGRAWDQRRWGTGTSLRMGVWIAKQSIFGGLDFCLQVVMSAWLRFFSGRALVIARNQSSVHTQPMLGASPGRQTHFPPK